MNKSLDIKINWSQLVFYFLVLVAFLAEGWFFSFFVPGQLAAILFSKDAVDRNAKEIADLQVALQKIQQADQESLSRYAHLATIALPNDKKTGGIVTGMSSLAATYGVGVKSLEFSPGLISSEEADLRNNFPVSLGGGVRQITANLTVSAKMSSLVTFLEGLERASQLIGVNSLTFNNNPQGDYASLLLNIYYQPLPLFNPQTAVKTVKLLTQEDLSLLESLSEKDVFTVLQE